MWFVRRPFLISTTSVRYYASADAVIQPQKQPKWKTSKICFFVKETTPRLLVMKSSQVFLAVSLLAGSQDSHLAATVTYSLTRALYLPQVSIRNNGWLIQRRFFDSFSEVQINQNEIVVGATVGVHNKVGFGFFSMGRTDFSKDAFIVSFFQRN